MKKRYLGLLLVFCLAIIMTISGCGLEKSVNQNSEPDSPEAEETTSENSTNKESSFKDVKADYTLKLSLQDPATNNSEMIAANIFKDYVEAQTNGKVQIQVYPGAQLGNERVVFEAIQGGDVDLGMITDGPMAGFVPEITVLSLPYIFKSHPIAWEVLDGPFGKELSDLILDETGVRTVGIASNGFRSFSTNKKLIKTLEDFNGMKIRVMENQLYLTMVNALGAQAVPMAGGEELYSALQQGVVDGQENPLDIIYQFKIHEVQDYITVDNHTFSSKWLVINDEKLQSMPKEYQQIIAEAGIIWKTHLQGPKEAAALAAFSLLQDEVKEIYVLPNSEKERFRDACLPAVIEWLEEQTGEEWIEKIQNAVKDAEEKLYSEL
ncbi:MAG: hypothetical protein APF76_18205 [Desulfitibacter sp. BRH_c19]|nr:MAG: hypothetical protein APF76_18205 [Desulfitibacter sp. BRH_c19]